MNDIRSDEQYVKDEPERRAELDAMGFVWDDLERRWELARDALAVYKELHGDLEVIRTFVVPSDAPWPAEAWGLKLGKRVHDIRRRGSYVWCGSYGETHPERRVERRIRICVCSLPMHALLSGCS